MLGGTGAVPDQTALPDAPPTLASDEGRLLPREKFRKLLTLLFSADEFIHVDLVPETPGKSLARNRHYVNSVLEIVLIIWARNQQDVDFVPK
jgi:hypothetical protein